MTKTKESQMLYRGPVGGGAASGKLGAMVASHNAAGQYLRARTVPTNPRTPQQGDARNALSALATSWTGLSALQQANWETFGKNTARKNRLGDTIFLSGIASYLANNGARVAAGLARVDDAPTFFGQTTLSKITAATPTAPNSISVAFDPTDPWATAVGGFLLVYVSRQQNSTVNFWAGPYRLLGTIAGAATAPTSPASFAYEPVGFGDLTAGNRLFFRYVAVTADGLVSSGTDRTVAVVL